MEKQFDAKRYLVKPGKKVKLKDWHPEERRLSTGDKAVDSQTLVTLNEHLDKLQDLLFAAHKHKILLVLQGMDTSGKDGTIRNVFNSVDPLGVRVANFKAPTEVELDRDYLWRVHNQVPGKGEIVIFNRSHYEDVLIVPVHNWITPAECEQRYKQINEFEKLLSDSGTVIIKCFLYISKDEQKARLEQRLADPEKRWKFRAGDVGERKLWKKYLQAYESALAATSARSAPWYVVPADSKTERNLIISSLLVQTLEGLNMQYPEPEEDLSAVVIE
ncbi:MAG: polyphosphate kinase 2 family protein [Pseudomonadota bacterium]|nr:polyphosphate kinase 2 family protein [Pseudomonadota bacterium]